MSTDLLSPVVLDGMEEFLGMISKGVGPKNAAIAVGWSLRQLRELQSDAQFVEVMEAAGEQLIESIEEKSAQMAQAGNVPMIQMWLYCKGADRGWRPPTHRVNVSHQGTPAAERVLAVTSAALELMAKHGHQALALGGPLDEMDHIVDAEVVDD